MEVRAANVIPLREESGGLSLGEHTAGDISWSRGRNTMCSFLLQRLMIVYVTLQKRRDSLVQDESLRFFEPGQIHALRIGAIFPFGFD